MLFIFGLVFLVKLKKIISCKYFPFYDGVYYVTISIWTTFYTLKSSWWQSSKLITLKRTEHIFHQVIFFFVFLLIYVVAEIKRKPLENNLKSTIFHWNFNMTSFFFRWMTLNQTSRIWWEIYVMASYSNSHTWSLFFWHEKKKLILHSVGSKNAKDANRTKM